MPNKTPNSAPALAFAPDIVRLEGSAPSPLPRVVLYATFALIGSLAAWGYFGRLDIVAVSHGKLVPQSFVKIVQPAEAGIVREILVEEGATVREGQVLVRMDSRLADADVRALKSELDRKRLQLRRIDAELAGTALRRAADDPIDIVAQVEAQLRARREAHIDAVGTEQALRDRARHDMASAAEIEAKLMQTTPIFREQEKAWDQLARDGFAGRLLALDRRRSRIEAEQELKAQTRNIESLKATIAQADRRIAQIRSTYRQELHNERAQTEALVERLRQDWEKLQHRHGLLELRAPQAGVVKDLATHTPGAVLAPGTVVLTLVPQNEPLLAEVWIGSEDAGFVHAGQQARIKLATYPFQKYGTLDGVIRQVSADAQERAAPGGDAGSKPPVALAYRALIALASDELHAGGRGMKLSAGMAVSAELHIGRRSVVEYLLSPIVKAGSEAGRER